MSCATAEPCRLEASGALDLGVGEEEADLFFEGVSNRFAAGDVFARP